MWWTNFRIDFLCGFKANLSKWNHLGTKKVKNPQTGFVSLKYNLNFAVRN
jgi:hypothetical protein